MKRAKMRRLIAEVLEARDAMPERPVTFDTLSVNFEKRTVKFRGRTIHCVQPATGLDIPLLNTDRLVVTEMGDVA